MKTEIQRLVDADNEFDFKVAMTIRVMRRSSEALVCFYSVA